MEEAKQKIGLSGKDQMMVVAGILMKQTPSETRNLFTERSSA